MSACKVLLFPSVGPHCRVQWGQLESRRFTTGDTQRTMDLASQQVSQPDSVADLLAATARGDRQAFAELYRLTHRRLYAIALALLRQPDAAEDVVQETYLAIWRTAGQYQPGRAPALIWLMAIVRHRAIELASRQGSIPFELRARLDLAELGSRSPRLEDLLAVAAFAAAHGSPDPWVVADLSVFAAAAGALTWRTGGLEAAIALHVVNNVVAIGSSLLLGGFEQGFIDSETAGSPGQFSGSLVVQGIAVWLLWRQAAKHQLNRRPPFAADGAVSSAVSGG